MSQALGGEAEDIDILAAGTEAEGDPSLDLEGVTEGSVRWHHSNDGGEVGSKFHVTWVRYPWIV